MPQSQERTHPLAVVLPTAQRLTGKGSFDNINVHRPDSLTLELPSLRRNHARRRTALRCPTPASLATATRPVCRMNLHPHSRSLLVPRYAGRSLVLSSLECSESPLFSARRTSLCNPSTISRHFKAPHHTQLTDLVQLLHPSSLIQST
jgi:hypothetical protein